LAKRRGGKQSPERYVEGMVELIGALSNIRNGGNGHADKPDPSVNVKELVELRASYEEKIRNLDSKWQERFDGERRRADEARIGQEAGRVDAKFADIVQSALLVQQTTANAAAALATTMGTTAETLRKSQETTDIATRAAIRAVETNQATGGGEKAAKIEQKGQTNINWNQAAQWAAVGLLAVAELHARGVI
jgi:hypothetical protein